jgi:predicted site-specific integrase-resolvase
MAAHRIGYARVSTRDQNLDLQLDALNQAGCDRIYQDTISGTESRRPGLDQALESICAMETRWWCGSWIVWAGAGKTFLTSPGA